MDALECLKTRRSVRAYLSDPVVPRKDIEEIVNAARLAATARNEQPWEFVVVTDKAMREKLADITEYGKFIAQSPLCIVVLCREGRYFLEDGSAATQNILLAAHALGWGSCWVAGDKKPYAEQIRKLIGAPETFKLISLVAIGKPDGPIKIASKRSLDEVIHWERF